MAQKEVESDIGSMETVCKTYPNWMEKLPEKLRRESLKNIAIPGSHDSFSFFLDLQSPVAAGSPDTVRNLVAMFGDAAKKIVQSWSVTQSLNFTQQLNLGIRYFDLRISRCPGKEGFYFAHGLHGTKVNIGLQEINEWLSEHPTEVVIIDFNHLYCMEENHSELISNIEEVFTSKLCPEMDLEAVTLDVLCAEGWQVIAIYHNEISDEHPNMWKGSSIHSVWPNTAEAPKMVNLLNAHHTRGRPQDKFYVSQGVLTPTGTTILQHMGRNLKDVLALPAIRNTKFFLQDKTIGINGINIVIVDFVEMEQYVDAVLALNTKE